MHVTTETSDTQGVVSSHGPAADWLGMIARKRGERTLPFFTLYREEPHPSRQDEQRVANFARGLVLEPPSWVGDDTLRPGWAFTRQQEADKLPSYVLYPFIQHRIGLLVVSSCPPEGFPVGALPTEDIGKLAATALDHMEDVDYVRWALGPEHPPLTPLAEWPPQDPHNMPTGQLIYRYFEQGAAKETA